MSRTASKINRRYILALSVAAVVLPGTATEGQPPDSTDSHDATQPELPAACVDRLARALSSALAANSGGKLGILVQPAGYVDEPVAVIDLAEAHDAAYSLSGGLVKAICEHVAAYSALGRASRAADAVRLGREPTNDERARLDSATDQAEVALMALCRYWARNGPERRERARYLVAFAKESELSTNHISALLEAELLHDTSRPIGPQAT